MHIGRSWFFCCWMGIQPNIQLLLSHTLYHRCRRKGLHLDEHWLDIAVPLLCLCLCIYCPEEVGRFCIWEVDFEEGSSFLGGILRCWGKNNYFHSVTKTVLGTSYISCMFFPHPQRSKGRNSAGIGPGKEQPKWSCCRGSKPEWGSSQQQRQTFLNSRFADSPSHSANQYWYQMKSEHSNSSPQIWSY